MEGPTRRSLLASGVAGLAAAAGRLAGSPDERPTAEERGDWPETPTWEPAAGSPRDADVTDVTAVRNRSVPWDLTFAAGDAYLTERTGGLLRSDAGTLREGEGEPPGAATTVLGGGELPDRTGPGEGGTLGVAAHPDYPDPRAVFVYYTADDDLRNRVVRYDVDAGELTTVVDRIPAAKCHNGGRITVGPDGHLWVLTGDARAGDLAQDATSPGGAVLRVTLAGDPAPGRRRPARRPLHRHGPRALRRRVRPPPARRAGAGRRALPADVEPGRPRPPGVPDGGRRPGGPGRAAVAGAAAPGGAGRKRRFGRLTAG